MKKIRYFNNACVILNICLITLIIPACKQQSSGIHSVSREDKMNGISLAASPRVIDDSTVQSIRDMHANWVCLMPFAFVENIHDVNIHYNSERQWHGETIEGIKETMDAFKKKGVHVMLKPQLWVGWGSFTGDIEMQTEANWDSLEQDYSHYILDFAKVAESENCDMLCIGTELNKFVVARPAYWNNLIDSIRKIYKGKLTYAENWDAYSKVPFWKKLDFIGINAYFPLSDEKNVSLKPLENSWEKYIKKLSDFSSSQERKILFTEYGYRSSDYTARAPWDEKEEPVNFSNQAIALQALYNSCWDQPWFAGGFLWKWYDGIRNVFKNDNTDFTPQNKPAENVVKKMYEKQININQ